MTGFGKSQVSDLGYLVTCEVRGVNHRFLDPNIRIPRRYNILEERIKEELKKLVTRGRLEISINIEKTEESVRNIKLDKDLAIVYYNNLKDLADNLRISSEIDVIDIFRLPDVFTLQDDEEDMEIVWQVLQQALSDAMQGVIEMRTREGHNLAVDLSTRNKNILKLVEKLEVRSPIVTKEYIEKLRLKIQELIDQESIDEQRILTEAAIFADRSNVTEEIVRLKSHVGYLSELLTKGDSVGRKCDFLVQEMLREINTIASKANDLEMNRIVVDVKAELEKIREQLQNIE
ncbi:MAG TPA: YicC/YloC family endoribonuclease [Syntrophomonadaceae bacterium]|nr:YicC/YloC family endoribonuclease [Syntrophomonadaceae bacterium]